MFVRAIPPLAVSALCLTLAPGLRQSFAPAVGTPAAPTPFPTSTARVSQDEFDTLARTRPLAMLEAALRRVEGELRGYRAVMTKQERIGGKLFPPETIRVSCREEPFAVRMIWDAGARTDGLLGYRIRGVRYAPGEKDPMVIYRPGALFEEQAVAAKGADARKTARVGIEESGLSHAARRTLAAWSAAEQRGQLDVSYLGVQSHPDAGNRPCHVVRRKCREEQIDPFVSGEPPVAVTARNRADAFDTVTVWIDRETWAQVGTEQHRAGELVARYFFNVTESNPAFGRDEFAPAALRK